jgi:pimeloyl-ACP methyl ester carboxylesterase
MHLAFLHRALPLLLAASLLGCSSNDAARTAADPPPELQLRPCAMPNSSEEFPCGTFSVAEDRSRPGGPRIALKVVVVPALPGSPPAAPLFLLAGGPGASVTPAAGELARPKEGELPGVVASLRRRTLILVDQRGTGGSNDLGCAQHAEKAGLAAVLSDMLPADILRACRAQQPAVAAHYSTTSFVADLDELAAALGYPEVDVMGTSYGTRVAQELMRLHPQRVRRVILEGVVPSEMFIPAPFARDAQRSLELLFRDCERDAACHAAFPHLRAEFAAVLARLEKQPVMAPYRDEKTGFDGELAMTRHLFAITIRKLLYGTREQARLPLLVHQAYRSDWQPFLREAVRFQRDMLDGIGLYLSIVCREDLPHARREVTPEHFAGAFLGDYWYRNLEQACSVWMREHDGGPAPRPEAFRSQAPVLMVSGDLDPVTPPYWAEPLAQRYRNSRWLSLPQHAHMFADFACMDELLSQFLQREEPLQLDAACAERVRRPPWELPPSPGG